jgi:hypothetical protein
MCTCDGNAGLDSVAKRYQQLMERDVNLLGKLLGRESNHLANAEALVAVSRVAAVPMIGTLREEYPVLNSVDSEQWDFIVTVAGVFIATSRLEHLRLRDKQKKQLLEVIARKMDEWKPDALTAFDDCKVLFEREFDGLTLGGHEARFVGSDAIGIWITWNILGRQPRTPEEIQLMRTVGVMVTGTMFNYWQ